MCYSGYIQQLWQGEKNVVKILNQGKFLSSHRKKGRVLGPVVDSFAEVPDDAYVVAEAVTEVFFDLDFCLSTLAAESLPLALAAALATA